jgi:sortase A
MVGPGLALLVTSTTRRDVEVAAALLVPMGRGRRITRSIGELLVTAGVVVLLFVVYLLWWTDLEQHRTQSALAHTIEKAWQAPTYNISRVAIGDGIAVLRIPRLGAHYREVIVEGVATADLQKGPGHVPDTALPGAPGNFVVSGHRTTYGKPFTDLDKVRPDDLIVVETAGEWLTYREVRELIVAPTAVEVIRPVPPGFSGPGRYLTFTTCNPKFSAAQRLILHGELVRRDAKSGDLAPPALRPGVRTMADLAGQT